MNFTELYEKCVEKGACATGLAWLAEQTDWACFLSALSLQNGYLTWVTRIPEAKAAILPLLVGADLEGANLARAKLTGANLKGADLTGANLTGADLEEAKLPGANFEGANFEGANLEGANLE